MVFFSPFTYKSLYVKLKVMILDYLFSVLQTALQKGQLNFQDPNLAFGKASPQLSIYSLYNIGEIIALSAPQFCICIKRRVVPLHRTYENRSCQGPTCLVMILVSLQTRKKILYSHTIAVWSVFRLHNLFSSLYVCHTYSVVTINHQRVLHL